METDPALTVYGSIPRSCLAIRVTGEMLERDNITQCVFLNTHTHTLSLSLSLSLKTHTNTHPNTHTHTRTHTLSLSQDTHKHPDTHIYTLIHRARERDGETSPCPCMYTNTKIIGVTPDMIIDAEYLSFVILTSRCI